VAQLTNSSESTASAAGDRSGPAKNLRILDLGNFLGGPFCSTLLAEMGAEVVKVEHPTKSDGLRHIGARTASVNGQSMFWAQEGRNKSFITCNLSTPAGQAIILDLVKSGFDVVLENYVPGTIERWNLSYETLAAANERVILARVSGYGQTGPRSAMPGYAPIAQGLGGLTYLCGEPGGEPLTPGSSALVDYVAGMFSAVGVLAAIEERNHSGRGQVIDVSLYESLLRVMDSLTAEYGFSGKVREAAGRFTPIVAPNGQFKTADGKWITLACGTDDQFKKFCISTGHADMIERPEFSSFALRQANAPLVNRLVENEITSTFNRDDLLKICDENRVPAAPVNSIADIYADPHVIARGSIMTAYSEEWGQVSMPVSVPRFSRTPGNIRSLGAMESGRDNEAVLGGLLGMSAQQLKELQSEGVI